MDEWIDSQSVSRQSHADSVDEHTKISFSSELCGIKEKSHENQNFCWECEPEIRLRIRLNREMKAANDTGWLTGYVLKPNKPIQLVIPSHGIKKNNDNHHGGDFPLPLGHSRTQSQITACLLLLLRVGTSSSHFEFSQNIGSL